MTGLDFDKRLYKNKKIDDEMMEYLRLSYYYGAASTVSSVIDAVEKMLIIIKQGEAIRVEGEEESITLKTEEELMFWSRKNFPEILFPF